MTDLIPEAARDRHIAVLGSTGAGKTSVAKRGIVEPILNEGGRVVILDPTAAWWGLRLQANGRTKGFPIYIFGGRHGDYPLRPKDAVTLAEAFGTSSDSAVFDTSDMTVADRTEFFIHFAETIFRKNRGKLHLIIDEAHLFMPQVSGGGRSTGGRVPMMINAGNSLVSGGRSRGLRITMITQRPAKLHKDSLTQAQSLIAMRVLHPLDRKAITDWIDEVGDRTKSAELVASLSGLKDGEAWIWAPLQGVLRRQQFPLPVTFDSSKAPDDDDAGGVVLQPLDLDALKGKLATIEAETKANDPAALKAEIARLKREMTGLAAKAATGQPVIDPNELSRLQQEAWADGYATGVDKTEDVIGPLIDQAARQIHVNWLSVAGIVDKLSELRKAAKPSAPSKFPSGQQGQKPAVAPVRVAPSVRKPAGDAGPVGDLSNPQRHLLRALAWWKAMGHDSPTRAQVAAIAGWKVTGSNLRNRLAELTTANLISHGSGKITILAAGLASAPEPDLSSETLVGSIKKMLTGPQLTVFNALTPGVTVARADLALTIGWEPAGSNLRNRLAELSALELVRYPSKGEVALQDWVV